MDRDGRDIGMDGLVGKARSPGFCGEMPSILDCWWSLRRSMTDASALDNNNIDKNAILLFVLKWSSGDSDTLHLFSAVVMTASSSSCP